MFPMGPLIHDGLEQAANRFGDSDFVRADDDRWSFRELDGLSNAFARHLAANKLAITEQAGVVYSPFADKWSLSSDMDVNYMVVAEGV